MSNEVYLNEICHPKQWETIPVTSLTKEGYPVYGANGIIGSYREYNHEKPTLLITCRGATCGELNICQPFSYITGNAMCLDDLDEERANLNFLYYALKKRGFQDVISGTAQPQITREGLSYVKVSLPSLTEQKRIASLLRRADRLHQLRGTAHELGESLLQSVFLEMFGDLLANVENWDMVFLEDIADVQGGIQVTSSRNSMKLKKPYLRVANVYRNQLDLSEIKMIGLTESEFERIKLQKNDLLFVEGHGNINEIGRAAIWDGSIEDCVHQNHLIRARLDLKSVNPVFVSHYMNSPAGRSYFTNNSNTTSGLNTVSTNTVKSCSLPLPPLNLQEEFAGMVRQVESLRGRMSEAERQVDRLFESLLEQAFNQI